MLNETRYNPTGLDRKPDYEFRQEVYGVISLYMEALSPKQISETLREIANEEAKRET